MDIGHLFRGFPEQLDLYTFILTDFVKKDLEVVEPLDVWSNGC